MPEPLVLGFDTSAAHCAAALLRGDEVLGRLREDMTKGQAERLFPMLEQLLSQCSVSWPDLSAIGVGIGPGNFTGIRVSVAAARGLALALGIPAIGVTATEAAAFGVPRPCRVVIPSRRDQVIWQDFGDATRTCEGESRPQQAVAGALPPGPAPAAPAVALAEAIARIAMKRRNDESRRPAPFYLKPADAAPSSDPPPVILP